MGEAPRHILLYDRMKTVVLREPERVVSREVVYESWLS